VNALVAGHGCIKKFCWFPSLTGGERETPRWGNFKVAIAGMKKPLDGAFCYSVDDSIGHIFSQTMAF